MHHYADRTFDHNSTKPVPEQGRRKTKCNNETFLSSNRSSYVTRLGDRAGVLSCCLLHCFPRVQTEPTEQLGITLRKAEKGLKVLAYSCQFSTTDGGGAYATLSIAGHNSFSRTKVYLKLSLFLHSDFPIIIRLLRCCRGSHFLVLAACGGVESVTGPA